MNNKKRFYLSHPLLGEREVSAHDFIQAEIDAGVSISSSLDECSTDEFGQECRGLRGIVRYGVQPGDKSDAQKSSESFRRKVLEIGQADAQATLNRMIKIDSDERSESWQGPDQAGRVAYRQKCLAEWNAILADHDASVQQGDLAAWEYMVKFNGGVALNRAMTDADKTSGQWAPPNRHPPKLPYAVTVDEALDMFEKTACTQTYDMRAGVKAVLELCAVRAVQVVDTAATSVSQKSEPDLWYIRVPDEPEIDQEDSPAEYFYAESKFDRDRMLKKPGATILYEYQRSPVANPGPVAWLAFRPTNQNGLFGLNWPEVNRIITQPKKMESAAKTGMEITPLSVDDVISLLHKKIIKISQLETDIFCFKRDFGKHLTEQDIEVDGHTLVRTETLAWLIGFSKTECFFPPDGAAEFWWRERLVEAIHGGLDQFIRR